MSCHFLVVEPLFLRASYVLFFIELGIRRLHVAGCIEHPTAAWVTQQARNHPWRVQDYERKMLPERGLSHGTGS